MVFIFACRTEDIRLKRTCPPFAARLVPFELKLCWFPCKRFLQVLEQLKLELILDKKLMMWTGHL